MPEDSGMDGKTLLAVLMKSKGHTQASLQRIIANAICSQPQIQRYLKGHTDQPRRAFLKLLASQYGISAEAFTDPAMAQAIADNLQANRPLMHGLQSVRVEVMESAPDRMPKLSNRAIGIAEAFDSATSTLTNFQRAQIDSAMIQLLETKIKQIRELEALQTHTPATSDTQ